MCIYNVYVYVHKLHLAVSQLDARNTRHFSSGIIFTKRLARQPPTLVQRYTYMYVYIHIYTLVMPFPRAASAVSNAVCTRALLISSKYETSKTIVPSTIPLSPSALPEQPTGEKSRGDIQISTVSILLSPLASSCIHLHTSFTLLLRARFMLVPWKISMAHDQR